MFDDFLPFFFASLFSFSQEITSVGYYTKEMTFFSSRETHPIQSKSNEKRKSLTKIDNDLLLEKCFVSCRVTRDT